MDLASSTTSSFSSGLLFFVTGPNNSVCLAVLISRLFIALDLDWEVAAATALYREEEKEPNGPNGLDYAQAQLITVANVVGLFYTV